MDPLECTVNTTANRNTFDQGWQESTISAQTFSYFDFQFQVLGVFHLQFKKN